MSNFDHLPDDATRLSSASVRAYFTAASRDHTVVGWLGRYALVVLLLGGAAVFGSLLLPVLYALAQ